MAKTKKLKPKKTKEEIPYVWAIAYINRDLIDRTEKELKQYGYQIETYIPTVRIIKKKFKNKDMFEFVPLLFNYGFFRIPLSDACNPEYLMMLRSRISCIYGWVKDPANSIKNKTTIRQKEGNAIPGSALATDKEISDLIKTSDSLNIYSAEELGRFKPGDLIQLKGYPFDDMPAEIISINLKKKEIKVSLQISQLVKEVTVSFENVFYTVYQGFDDSLSNNLNLDDMESKKLGSSDKLMFETEYYEK